MREMAEGNRDTARATTARITNLEESQSGTTGRITNLEESQSCTTGRITKLKSDCGSMSSHLTELDSSIANSAKQSELRELRTKIGSMALKKDLATVVIACARSSPKIRDELERQGWDPYSADLGTRESDSDCNVA
jgi:chromosome segregation ATPase